MLEMVGVRGWISGKMCFIEWVRCVKEKVVWHSQIAVHARVIYLEGEQNPSPHNLVSTDMP